MLPKHEDMDTAGMLFNFLQELEASGVHGVTAMFLAVRKLKRFNRLVSWGL